MDGLTVPMIARWERGVINRFMYSILVLSPFSQTSTLDLSAWNRKALFSFSGGVAIGHYQGAASGGDMRYLPGLGMGYAVLYSSGTRTNTHYNLQLGGETAIMVKDHFVSKYAEPEYTVAVGGSGGAIQQYVYGQNHPGPDRRRRSRSTPIPTWSRRRSTSATASCSSAGRDSRVLARSALDLANVGQPLADRRAELHIVDPESLCAVDAVDADARLDRVHQRLARTLTARAQPALVRDTAARLQPGRPRPGGVDALGDLVNIYGTDETGFARVPWDNVGVQYGLAAVTSGTITPAQFLDLNANVGSWKRSADMVQEGCPFVGPPASARRRTSGARAT